jgi:D-beta-D-heptose 7-phosphate kinase/D-beta-D-heptose 1-phosphate adenosyltransferase
MGIEKIVPLERAYELVDDLKRRGRRVVLTNGCFDLLHPGHTRLFREARQLGDALMVAMNSDRSVWALKGHHRAIQPEAERAEILAGLAAIDYVTIFDDPSVLSVVTRMLPHILGGEKVSGTCEEIGFEEGGVGIRVVAK